MVAMIFRNAKDRTNAAVLVAALLTLLCVRIVLFCLATISARRGCLKVPGEGFASAFLDAGVVGAVTAPRNAGDTDDTAEDRDVRAEAGTSDVAVEDIPMDGGNCSRVS